VKKHANFFHTIPGRTAEIMPFNGFTPLPSEDDLTTGNVYRQNTGESIDDFLERISCIE
jgi:hypothetical protein